MGVCGVVVNEGLQLSMAAVLIGSGRACGDVAAPSSVWCPLVQFLRPAGSLTSVVVVVAGAFSSPFVARFCSKRRRIRGYIYAGASVMW